MADRPYHHGDLRRALLDAARRRLEDGGPAALALRALAREVGVSAPSVYHHFGSLDALTLALAEEGFAELAAALEGAGDPGIGMGLAYLRFARANPGLYRLMFGEGLRRDSPEGAALQERRRAAFAPVLGHASSPEAAIRNWALVHGLAALINDGQLPPGPTDDARLLAILRAD